MRKTELKRKSLAEEISNRLDSYEFWRSAAWAFISIAVGLLGLFAPFIVEYGAKSKPYIPSPNALAYFVGGIVLLAIIVVGIASFMRHRNRGAILLKRRLSEIYLSALRRSAFNPQLGSPTVDD